MSSGDRPGARTPTPPWDRSSARDAGVVLAILVPFYLKLLALPLAIGNDSQTHAHKVQVFVRQLLSEAPLAQAGIYDWSWYAGYPFLQVYAPLFYWLASPLSLAGVDPLVASHAVAAASFALGAAGVYATVAHLTGTRGYAAVAAAVYVYFPTHQVSYITFGGLPRTLAVGIAPVAFYYTVRYLETGRHWHFRAWVLAGGSVVLANHGVGFVFTGATCLWLLLRRRVTLSVGYGIYCALLGSLYLVPYVTYDVPNGLPVMPPEITLSMLVQGVSSFGSTPGVVAILLFLGVASQAFRSDAAVDAHLWPTVAVVGLFVVYNVVAFLSGIDLLELAAYGRSTPVFEVFGAVALGLGLAAVDFDRTRFDRSHLLTAVVILLVVEGLLVGAYTPRQPVEYDAGFDAIEEDSEEWSRWVMLPREPVAAFSTDRVGKPTIGGWYVQGMHAGLYDALGSTMHPTFIELERDIAYGNAERELRTLEYVGVEYILVEGRDPPIGVDLSRKLSTALANESRLTRIEAYGSVAVYRIENFSTVEGYRTRPTTRAEYLRPTMAIEEARVESTATSRTFAFTAPADGWVVIPVAHTDSTAVRLDGRRVEATTAYAGMTRLRVDEGRHRVTVTPSLPARTRGAVFASIAALAVLLLGGARPLAWVERAVEGRR